MGATEKQTLGKVQLPMAKQMIVLGINQTVMAALSFVVIAALIAAPGLGKPVIDALIIRNTGRGFVAGLAVVFLAIMLDRATSAAAKKQQSFIPPSAKQLRERRIKVILAGVAALISAVLSNFVSFLAVFPAKFNIATQVENITNNFTEFLTTDFYFLTIGFKDLISIWVLNPIENVLAQAPWYLTIAMIVFIAVLLGGVRVAALAFGLLILIVLSGLWFDAMITLTQTIVATLLTMIVG